MTRIIRTLSRLTLLLGCLSLVIQPSETMAQRSDDVARWQSYTGLYVLPSGVQLAVELSEDGLAVRPVGRRLFETQQAASRVLDEAADAVLTGFAARQTEPLWAALRDFRREQAVADLTHLFDIFTEGHGPIISHRVLGSATGSNGRAWTLAHVTFERGREIVRFVWKAGRLTSIQRGAYATSGTRYAASARYKQAPGNSEITFNLRNNGTVESMTVVGQHGAVTAYRLRETVLSP